MIKILHIIEDLELGGAERRLVNDLKYLDRNKFVHVICALRPKVEFKEEHLAGLPVYIFDVNSIYKLFKNLPRIDEIINKHRIDIIHTQLFWADLAGRLLKFLHPGIKLITTIQSSAHEDNNSDLYSYKRKIIDGITGRLLNDGFIAVSEHVKQVSIRTAGFSPDKTRVIYNSVDLEYETPASKIKKLREEFRLNDNEKVVLSTGRLVPAKGHAYLIKAIPFVKKIFPGVKLIIIGEGPEKENLIRECRKLNISNNVLFAGKRNDARDILRLGNIFVFPALYGEGLSLALLEALASGIPCIVTSLPQNEEAVKDYENGMVVSPRSHIEIADIITYLFSRPEKILPFSSESLKAVREKFSAEASALALEDYYLKIFSGNQ